MMRLLRVATLVAGSFLMGAGLCRAQAPAAAGSDQSRAYLEVTAGATVGHNASGSFGAEGGVRVMNGLDAFLEGGRMKNIGTSDLDNRAQIIGTAVGATAASHYEVNFVDLGVRYHVPMTGRFHPFVALGAGVAQVRSVTTFNVGGAATSPDALGIQLGSDLSGALKKPLLMFGGGASMTFAKSFFADASIRYGHIFPKTSQIDNDTGINTVRIQLGLGVKF
jgi:opacity protein-like surface antigen